MTRLGLLIALVLVASPALATPFDGDWYMVCPASPEDDILPITISGDRIAYYESECTIGAIDAVGEHGKVWKVSASCSGEGETWTSDLIYGLDQDAATGTPVLAEIDLDQGFLVVYRACGQPAE